MIRIGIPGEPHAQQRHRSRIARGNGGQQFVHNYDPPESKSWKKFAQDYMREAMSGVPMFEGPTSVRIVAVFALAKSHHRKQPRPRAWKTGKKEPDNIAKAVMDAANGVLWIDDVVVSRLVVDRVLGAQGEPPRTIVEVESIAFDGCGYSYEVTQILDRPEERSGLSPRHA